MPDQHPLLRENLLLFLRKNLRRNKILLFERLRASCESLGRLTKCGSRVLTLTRALARDRAQIESSVHRLRRFPQIYDL